MRRSLFLAGAGALAASPRAAAAADAGQSYVAALAAVDAFLEAWRRRDATAGIARLTPGAQKRLGAANLRGWLIGVSSPGNAGYEVSGGRALSATRYRFTVQFFYALAGGGVVQPPAQSVDVARLPNGTWLVDAVTLTGPSLR